MLYFILALDFEIATPPVKQKGVKMAYKKDRERQKPA